MNFKKILLIAVVGICFLGLNSCGENTATQQLPELKITPKDILTFDQIASEVEFIPMIIPEESPLKLLPFDPILFISDKIYFSTGDYNDASVHVFDIDGKYQRSFNRQGGGPGEYRELSALEVWGNDLVVWDGFGTFYQYSLEDFSFVKTIKISERKYIPDYQKLDDHKWILVFDIEDLDHEGYYTVFHLYDSITKSIQPLPIKAPALTSDLTEGMIAKIEGEAYLLNFGASDTLFSFQNGKVLPWVKLNLDNNNLPENDKQQPEETIENLLMEQRYNFNTGAILAAGNTVRIPVFGLNKVQDFDPDNVGSFPIYDVYVKYPNPEVKVSRAFGNFGGKGFSKDGYFYEWLYAEYFMAYLESGFFGKFTADLENAMEKLVDQEDPILVKYKVRF